MARHRMASLAKTHIRYMIKTDSPSRRHFEEIVAQARQGKLSTDRINRHGYYTIMPDESDCHEDIYVFADVDITAAYYTVISTAYRGYRGFNTGCAAWQQFYLLMDDGTEFYYLNHDESKARELILYVETGIVPEWASQNASNEIVTDPDELVF